MPYIGREHASNKPLLRTVFKGQGMCRRLLNAVEKWRFTPGCHISGAEASFKEFRVIIFVSNIKLHPLPDEKQDGALKMLFEDGMVEQEETSQRTLEVEIVRHAYRRSWRRKKRKNRLRTIGSKRPRTSTLNRSSTKSTKVEDSDLVCTYPMFGPESGKDGSKDLNFMYERVRVRDEDLCSSFPRIFEHKMSSLEPSQIPSNFIWLFMLKLSGSQWQSKDGWVTWILLDMDSCIS
ncbi:NAD(P)-binding domain-containing protein [Artemisia annua]|uniref:NAD(P)-binding domain-containing protein n=1 Tax=Artemisia annua TaxID=35608 RepID=A0A2U1MGH4_ARTAN|nr:NAD(P)-binding domain-containing protein [Artemisia annua]